MMFFYAIREKNGDPFVVVIPAEALIGAEVSAGP